jgi:hypothetical protein
MLEMVVALIMYLDGSMIEHTYKDKMSACLKSKRIAEREVNPQSVRFSCKKVNAKTEIYQGRKKILSIEE